MGDFGITNRIMKIGSVFDEKEGLVNLGFRPEILDILKVALAFQQKRVLPDIAPTLK